MRAGTAACRLGKRQRNKRETNGSLKVETALFSDETASFELHVPIDFEELAICISTVLIAGLGNRLLWVLDHCTRGRLAVLCLPPSSGQPLRPKEWCQEVKRSHQQGY